MDATAADDILLRISALRGLGGDLGGGGGTKWILLDAYNKKVTKHFPHAIQLVELLGISDALMRDNFGAYWRRSFKEKMNGLGDGFTTRTYLNVNFVSVGDGDGNYVRSKSNIIAKGSKDAADIRNHIDDAVSGDGESVDDDNMEMDGAEMADVHIMEDNNRNEVISFDLRYHQHVWNVWHPIGGEHGGIT